MKKIRVITAVILIIALSFVTVIGSAENDIENNGIIQAEEQFVEKLLYLGVITEAYADLGGVVTRADMAKIIVDFANISDIKPENTESPFADIEDGTDGAEEINFLRSLGYISGTGDNLFHPLRNVTLDEATVFLINAAGYKIMAEAKGGYPNGYLSVAADLKLPYAESFTRGDAARLFAKALKTQMFEVLSYGETLEYKKTDTLLYKVFGVETEKGRLTDNIRMPNSHAAANLAKTAET